ncbi:MAG TPA: hypothetical protein VEA37_05410 [Flavobacterium sp.]|nr:hypothetical protein [Flavobacterium sp.]
MKQTLLFVVIITLCGSLTKPPIVPVKCGTKVKNSYYLKGKLVHTDISDKYGTYGTGYDRIACGLHGKTAIKFTSDSIVYEVYYRKNPAYGN